MDLQFRILGPVAVQAGGSTLSPGSSKQRALLAALLLEPNTVVPLDRLIAALWEGPPPASAVANLRTYASRLRAALSQATGASPVVGRPTGYLVEVADDALDALVFEREVDAGHKAAADGAAARAVEHFGRALALWTGPAAQDVPRFPQGLGVALEALDEQRLSTVEAWLDVRLRQGETAAVVAELRRLTAAHPLRERLWTLLVSGLYAAGDTAAALAAYGKAREVFADELGVDPGPELARAHRAVLHREPAPGGAETAPSPAEVTGRPGGAGPAGSAAGDVGVPRDLPRDVVFLVGRDAELARLLAAVRAGDGAQVVAVYGPGGVGKSALAVHAAHLLARDFPAGQLYLDLHGAAVGLPPAEPADILRRLLRALGVPGDRIPAGAQDAADRCRAVLAGRRMILVLDNAVDEAQLRAVLAAVGGCAVVITGRRHLAALDEVSHLRLGPLAEQPAMDLLGAVIGAERALAAPERLRQLVGLCDRLPLALRIAGARLAVRPDWTPATLVAQLADERRRLDTLAFSDLAVRSSLEVSVGELARAADAPGRHAGRLLLLLGVLRLTTLTASLAAAVLGLPAADADEALGRLLQASLLEPDESGRHRMHDLVRLYAAELAAGAVPAADRAQTLERALAWYLASSLRARQLIRPMPVNDDEQVAGAPAVRPAEPADAAAALAWWTHERDSIFALARQAVEHGPTATRYLPRLMAAMYHYLATNAYWDELAELAELSLGPTIEAGDRRAEAASRVALAVVHSERGRGAQALEHLYEVLRIRREDGDEQGMAGCLSHLGIAHLRAGDPGRALAALERSAALHARLAMPVGEGIARNECAAVLCHLGRHTEAAEQFRQALALRRAAGDLIGEAISVYGLGKVSVLQGRHEAAVGQLTDALARCHDAGVRTYTWRALLWRADALHGLGRTADAIADVAAAEQVCAELRDSWAQGVAALLLGLLWAELRQPGPAAGHAERGRALMAGAASRPGDDLILLRGGAVTGLSGC
ncbi:AfsR/SARP family transcriptional regulator [Catellatospora vulcania]|uniref:AfsR/SARP family transcriptional regulator n=1 Tax=Catellatospora vulcania TaxID=1460450 RepID=UPI0012D3D72B|nr:BTAD domain-containing putative transcriptional regulator [Catellatospora vulcania]